MRSNLETVIPGLAAAREAEHLNRAIAFAGLHHRVCGVEVRPITPATRLRLQMLRNAFAVADAEPLEGDVFQLLWVLSPHWRPLAGWQRVLSEWSQWRLRRHVRRLELRAAVRECFEFISSQVQDDGERGTSGDGADFAPWIHWLAQDASFWINIHGGFTLESYRETPLLVLQGLYRAWSVNHPDVVVGADGKPQTLQPSFINASDRIIGAWHHARRQEVADILKAQVFRIQ